MKKIKAQKRKRNAFYTVLSLLLMCYLLVIQSIAFTYVIEEYKLTINDTVIGLFATLMFWLITIPILKHYR